MYNAQPCFRLLILFFLFVGSHNIYSQAQIEFEEATFDFGEIEEGTIAEHEFVFTNTGDQPLILSSVKASCGCTTPSWTKEPILPGKNGHVKASYNSKNRPGRFNKTITITSNSEKPTQVVYIKGTAVKSLSQEPLFTPEELENAPRIDIIQQHTQLGKVQVGSSIPVQLTLINKGKSSLEIKGILSNCRCMNLMPGGDLEVDPGAETVLEVIFTPRNTGDYTYGAYILSNDLVQPKYQIYLSSTVVPQEDQSSVVKEAPSKLSF